MEKIINPKEYFERKAEKLYRESEECQENYKIALKQFEMKYKNGKKLTNSDAHIVLDAMAKLQDSLDIQKKAIMAEHEAKKFQWSLDQN